MSKKTEMMTRPWCPFCGMDVGAPTDSLERKMNEFPAGRCECGAVYVCDATGHNVGSAMVECLVTACGDEWDLAWELIPEEDYLTGRLEDYDDVTHQVVPKRNLDGRAVRGVLFFVRLHKEMEEVLGRLEQRQAQQGQDAPGEGSEAQVPEMEPERDPKRKKQRASKKLVKELAAQRDLQGLVDLSFDDIRTLRFLQRLLYAPDEATRYRMAWTIGTVSARVATREPGPVADMLHRLFESCSDSASSSWGMVEAIGAIIANRPDIYGAFARHLYSYLSDPGTRNAVLWGMGEVAAIRPDLIRKTPFYSLFNLLEHEEAVTRGLMLRLLGRIRAGEVGFQIIGLQQDQSPVVIYEQGEPVATTVAQLADEALQSIHTGDNINGE